MQINVGDFVKESWEDYKSPTTSTFTSKMGHCRHTVSTLEETLDVDRSGLTKMKKSVKALYNTGSMHVQNEAYMAENLERLGNNAKVRENEAEISAAFMKFSHVTKELASMMKNLMQSLHNIMLFPLDQFLKGDLKGVKGDLKKPFDKAWKEYEAKFSKIEKEKKQQAKEAGMIRTEVSGAEIADEMEKERKIFQLHMCEYLIKINEIRTKKGVDLLQYLVEFYHAQANFFQDGLKTINHFHGFIEELVTQLKKIKQRQDNERKQLIELRDALKSSMSSYKEHAHHRLSGGGWPSTTNSSTPGYSLHQLQGNKIHGSEKTGYLLKKSEGRMRRVWQKRRCIIKEGLLYISHHDENKDPVKLNLLTCQVKLVHDDPGKKCFDLVSSSNNRTYHFQADDVKDMEAWISVLNNAKEEVLLKAFQDSSNSPSLNQNVRELTNSIIDRVKRLPGNKYCCDCGAPDPEWLSTNLGVLICLECCGIHRQMGVHVSRTQSIVIDELGTSQLLLARVVGNSNFNDIMEATLDPSQKPKPSSHMDDRRDFIRAKYEHHRYAILTCTDKDDLKQDLRQAILSKDILALLQVYAEDLDLMAVLPDMENDETALHLAIIEEDGSSLPIVDFIIQNSAIGSLEKRTRGGNTALHLCAELDRTECLKLLLRTRPDLANIENKSGKTAMDLAKEHNNHHCAELLKSALTAKKDQFLYVNVDWDLMNEERLYDYGDYSDDDLDKSSIQSNSHYILGTPDKQKPRSRPPSLIVLPDTGLFGSKDGHSSRDRLDSESGKLPPPPPPAVNKPKKYITMPSKYRHNNNKVKSVPGLNAPNSQGGRIRTEQAPRLLPPRLLHPYSSHMTRRSLKVGSLPPLPPRSKKPPPPPSPTSPAPGHVRNRSEPDASYLVHKRTASDPPPRPAPPDFRNTINIPAGAKLVLPMQTDGDKSGPSKPLNRQRGKQRDEARFGRSHSIDPPETESRDAAPPPVPNPRLKTRKSSIGRRRCRALYDCDADNDDELTFKEGEIILVLKEEEEEWWEGEVEGHPGRRGLFPVSFVNMIPEG
ncbi:LOW QUALITY PROTEIN: arf-GAP with SH3 domain, ANK repeat and PH domain-containing protein 2-like [Haliotis rubra]|uniref:LOW QUALITY PROTEIN: arf-GAP with SH3 domain, ANK repeat and PH domain-containing protein 2-like n=1 Tax=Haliotis rubra TaxID=36100 RepID=UPI001EE5F9A0|nr:LOW QUALITY PROTEIN: arf-GAP with SH3 domain, ANK repeat and PH domain-containing protein 2-like [Haliotis rubra]